MDSIIIEAQQDQPFIPVITFDAHTGNCMIEGESYLENAFEFYEQLIQWVIAFSKRNSNPLVVSVKLRYFNTSTSRCLLDFFKSIKDLKDKGSDISVKWYYPDIDSDILMDGEDFMDEADLTMEFIEYSITPLF